MPNSPPRHGQARVDANRKARQKQYNQKQRTNQEFYNSWSWRKLRNWYIRANPLCVDCKASGLTVAGHLVDHIVPLKKGGAALDSENLQTLCNYHHSQKTAKDTEQDSSSQRAGQGGSTG